MKDWHDPATWGGSLPSNGSAVNIPANTKVLISSCSIDSTYVFGLITIPSGLINKLQPEISCVTNVLGSSLIFGDAPIQMSATGMKVNGALLMGSPTCRLRNKITLTIYGKVKKHT